MSIPNLEQDIEKLFTAYGAACHAAQLFERSFQMLLISQQASINPEQADQAVGYIESETARSTLRALFDIANIAIDRVHLNGDALAERYNWLRLISL